MALVFNSDFTSILEHVGIQLDEPKGGQWKTRDEITSMSLSDFVSPSDAYQGTFSSGLAEAMKWVRIEHQDGLKENGASEMIQMIEGSVFGALEFAVVNLLGGGVDLILDTGEATFSSENDGVGEALAQGVTTFFGGLAQGIGHSLDLIGNGIADVASGEMAQKTPYDRGRALAGLFGTAATLYKGTKAPVTAIQNAKPISFDITQGPNPAVVTASGGVSVQGVSGVAAAGAAGQTDLGPTALLMAGSSGRGPERVKAEIRTQLSPEQVVKAVFDDVENYPSFMKGVNSARILERRPDGSLIVEMKITGGIKNKIHMKKTANGVEWNQLEGKVDVNNGGWIVERVGSETKVTYWVEVGYTGMVKSKLNGPLRATINAQKPGLIRSIQDHFNGLAN